MSLQSTATWREIQQQLVSVLNWAGLAEVEAEERTDDQIDRVNHTAARKVAVVGDCVETRARSTLGTLGRRLPRVVLVFGGRQESKVSSNAKGVVDAFGRDISNLGVEQAAHVRNGDVAVQLGNLVLDVVEQVVQVQRVSREETLFKVRRLAVGSRSHHGVEVWQSQRRRCHKGSREQQRQVEGQLHLVQGTGSKVVENVGFEVLQSRERKGDRLGGLMRAEQT